MTPHSKQIAEFREKFPHFKTELGWDYPEVDWECLEIWLTESLETAERRGEERVRKVVKKKIFSMRMYAQDDGANGKGYASGFWRVLDEIESSLKPTSEEKY